LEKISTEENSSTTETAAADHETEKLVVGEVPDHWDLKALLSTSQLHPGTRKKLQEWEVEAWVLVSHMLYAHSRAASGVDSPMAIVGSALNNDPLNGFGGYYDVLAQLPPKDLAVLIEQAYNFATRHPREYYYQDRQSGNQAWDLAMAKTDPKQLHWLALRLGIVKA